MRDRKNYIITLGECIDEISTRRNVDGVQWYEVMDIKIAGLREAFARASENAEDEETFRIALDQCLEIEAEFIRAHEHDLYLVQKPDGYGETRYIKQGASAVHYLDQPVTRDEVDIDEGIDAEADRCSSHIDCSEGGAA